MKESKYWHLVLLLWLFGIMNSTLMIFVLHFYENLLVSEAIFWGMLPLTPVVSFMYFLSRTLCRERLELQFANHESKRHFQVIQSLLYLEKYEEVKLYMEQIEMN